MNANNDETMKKIREYAKKISKEISGEELEKIDFIEIHEKINYLKEKNKVLENQLKKQKISSMKNKINEEYYNQQTIEFQVNKTNKEKDGSKK